MLLVATTGLLWVACGNPVPPGPSAAKAVRKECPRQSSDTYYFPEGVMFPSDAHRDREDRWGAGKYLGSLDVPSLSCGGDATEAYRLLWIHTNLPAIVASVTRLDAGWRAEAAEFRHPKTDLFWAVERRMERQVSNEQIRPLLDALDAADFWISPAWKSSDANDGATWYVEGRLDGGYRLLGRGNPTLNDAPFIRGAQILVQLAGMTVPEEMK